MPTLKSEISTFIYEPKEVVELIAKDLKVQPRQVMIRVIRDYDNDFAGIEVEVDKSRS